MSKSPCTPDREPPGQKGQIEEKQGSEECRKRHPAQGDNPGEVIWPPIEIERRDDRQWQGQTQRKEQCEAGQHQGVDRSFGDQAGGRSPLGKRIPEIALYDLAEPFEVLKMERLIQTELSTHAFDL